MPLQDVADFLAPHPPFDSLEPADVERVAEAAEVEFHTAGTEIFQQGTGPVEHVWVVRTRRGRDRARRPRARPARTG